MTSRQRQTVVVTGASGGIGRASAVAFRARGAQIALLARGEKANVHATMVQMPAVNTPQFSWVLSRLPKHLGLLRVGAAVATTTVAAVRSGRR
ncbi:SDR family NAD(P)-dependent oxidoreductase [Kribbella sp. NPDC051586]|uniref:SDR family NAD(P)-dependent oxidoreductase n=1 Tax=Kribbella sp. NPDC051586 TaxID=3364118 RepID=UPI00378E4CA4